jgi:molybdopterin converting factor small subunit
MADVRVPNLLRVHTDGQAVVSADGATVGEVFQVLVAEYPGLSNQLVDEAGELHKFVNVYVDDDDIRYLDKLDTKLADGATISILPAVAGGSISPAVAAG